MDGHTPVRTLRSEHQASGPAPAPGSLLTVVEVAEVPGVEEKVGSEKLPEAALARPERERGVQVQAAGPVRLPAQVVSWGGKQNGSQTWPRAVPTPHCGHHGSTAVTADGTRWGPEIPRDHFLTVCLLHCTARTTVKQRK